jgi:lysophospholipase L1-like esterase
MGFMTTENRMTSLDGTRNAPADMVSLRCLARLLSVLCLLPAVACSAAAKPAAAHPVCPPSQVVAWGDSLTYGLTRAGGVWGQARPTWLETVGVSLGVPTKNFGVPSQGSAEIAVRQGGLQPRVTLSGGRIPAKSRTPVRIDAISPSDGWSQYADAGTMTMHGVLADVPGTLQHTLTPDADSFAFVPDAPLDTDISVPAASTFSGDEGADYRGCFEIIWAGNNNSAQPAAITRDVASMVSALPDPKRYLIVGIIPGVSDALSRAYGPRFVDLRRWLATEGPAAAGVVPTAADRDAIAAGAVPPSLTVDGTHFTQAAYSAIGRYLASLISVN